MIPAHSDFSALRKRSLRVSWSQAESVTCCLCARYFCWNSTHVSPVLRNKKFNFKRSTVHTRDCLPRNTGYQAGESRYSTSTCGALRNHDFPGFPGASCLQLDGSIVALSSGADHVEIKVLKFQRSPRRSLENWRERNAHMSACTCVTQRRRR